LKNWMRHRSFEEALGQLFMVGIPGPQFSSEAAFLLKKIRAGGIILFKRNYQDPDQLADLCRRLQALALELHSLPLFISIDQEGGRVLRLGPPFTQIPAPAEMAGAEDPEGAVRHYAQLTARELRLAGINMNLAPVLDVNLRGAEGLMASRCLGADPERVARLGSLYIRELQEGGVMAVAKHFPGIGDIALDPHHDLPLQDKDLEGLEATELIPFAKAVSLPVSAVMLTHTLYPALDPQWPASLSPTIITGLLREKLGYQGMVITDDLEMGAIGKHFEIEEAVLTAFQGGADILLICHNPEKIERAYSCLLKALKRGTIPAGLLQNSLHRILALKNRLPHWFLPQSAEAIREYFRQSFD
jgi:beta-N-acetylhexosaminidase